MPKKKKTILDALTVLPMEGQGYDIQSARYDLRKDIHVFVDYLYQRRVKRSVRENKIPKTDARRLAKLLSDPDALVDINAHDESDWLDFIDRLLLSLGLVSYDTEGEYLGYTSSSVSFTDNYIDVHDANYITFAALPLQHQEQRIFDTLVSHYSAEDNEFVSDTLFGQLNKFNKWRCASGVMPSIRFDDARIFLFNCLKFCRAGVWYDTASLISFLKQSHPFFLIPRSPKFNHQWEARIGRYGNFVENHTDSNKPETIPENAEDAFERVEGRFVERFLESIPLTLGYVDLAYGLPTNPGIRPSIGAVKGFRVNECFLRFMARQTPEPRIMVRPNHEIHVESEWYPAAAISKLSPLADLTTTDKICIFKLNREKVIAAMAADESRDVKKYLEQLAENPLPPNIAAELDEWAEHADIFTLYTGFGLIEGDNLPKSVDVFVTDALSDQIRMVRSPDVLFTQLEQAEQAPVKLAHTADKLKTPPAALPSAFAATAVKKQPPAKKPLMRIKRATAITLTFQDAELLHAFVKALIQEKCAVSVDQARQSLTYAAELKPQVNAAMKKLKKDYRIKIGDALP